MPPKRKEENMDLEERAIMQKSRRELKKKKKTLKLVFSERILKI